MVYNFCESFQILVLISRSVHSLKVSLFVRDSRRFLFNSIPFWNLPLWKQGGGEKKENILRCYNYNDTCECKPYSIYRVIHRCTRCCPSPRHYFPKAPLCAACHLSTFDIQTRATSFKGSVNLQLSCN